MAKENEEVKLDEAEIGKTGVKVSYVRFLSDSAAGYLLLLLTIAVLLHTGDMEHFRKHLNDGVLIALLVFLAILATPVGIAINVGAWFIFGGLLTWLEQFFYWTGTPQPHGVLAQIVRYFTFPTHRVANLQEIAHYFGLIQRNEWVRSYREAERHLEIFYPRVLQTSLGFVIGGHVFIRSACLVLAAFIPLWLVYHWNWGVFSIGLIVWLICILAASLTGLYRGLVVLSLYRALFPVVDLQFCRKTRTLTVRPVARGARLRITSREPFFVRWSNNNWKDYWDLESRPLLAEHSVQIPVPGTQELPLVLTFGWGELRSLGKGNEPREWLQKDFTIPVARPTMLPH